jgi:hypothetical protein
MTPEPMPEPDGPRDERFVYVVTAAGVEALRESAAAFDSERATPRAAAPDTSPSRTQG